MTHCNCLQCGANAQASKDTCVLSDTPVLAGYQWQWELAYERLGTQMTERKVQTGTQGGGRGLLVCR